MIFTCGEICSVCDINKLYFSAKCNSGRIAIQWFHIQHYLDYQYTKI